MSKVSLLDPNFKVIDDYLTKTRSDISILTLSQSLQDFRKQINLNWFSKFLEYDHISYLTEIWDALFQLLADSISDDPGLRISIFKTLGALIFALSPFIPFTTVVSFLSSIQNKPSNIHLSMAIIACFCHISQFVSPLNFDSFISKSPIVQCFSDLKQSTKINNQPQNPTFYVKYLPQIILNVKPLNTEFQRFLLNALLNTFGENPTLPFIFTILNLLKNAIDSQILINDMLQYINQRKQKRQLMLLMISPYLLENEDNNKKSLNSFQITQQMKDDLFDVAISTIKKDAPNIPTFSEFEEACRTLSVLLEKEESSKSIEKESKIKEALSAINCPSYLKMYTFPFIDSIDELTPKEDDKLSIITAKLSALSNFLRRSPSIENFECIFKIFISFLHTESKEILTNLINAVSKCLSIVTVDSISESENENSEKVKEIKKDLKILLEKFLNLKTSNFVQNVAIVNLIQSVNFDVGSMIIKNYRKISFHIVFNSCFSMHNNLSETAINVLKSIIQYKTISDFISLLFNEIDFFDSFALFKICRISNLLIETIGYQAVSELNCLIEPIFESLVLIHQTSSEPSMVIRTEAEAFSFFNQMKEISIFDDHQVHFLSEKQENALKIICFDLISRIFESYTGINPQLPSTSPQLQPITSLIETDILLKSFDDQTYFRKALQECMIFLSCIQNKNQKEFSNEKFTELLIRLVKILPEETLKILQCSNSSFFVNSDSYLLLLFDIMKTTNSVSVASQCALACSSTNLMEKQIRIFLQSQQQPIQPQNLHKIKMYNFVLKFINKKLIKNGRCKFNFIQYLKKVHQIYDEYQSNENDKLPLPEIELDSKTEIALYEFLESDDKIEFIESVGFHDWPILDKEFSLFILKNQEKMQTIKLNSLGNNLQFTNEEIKFIAQNWKLFDKEVIKIVKENYFESFDKLFNEEAESYIGENESSKFNFNFSVKKSESSEDVIINDRTITCSSSIIPFLQSISNDSENQSNPTLSIPLIKNFFIFQKDKSKGQQKIVVSDQLFNQMLSLLIEDEIMNSNSFDLNLVINYAIENKIQIDFKLIKKILENDELIKYVYIISIYFKVFSKSSFNVEQLSSYLLSLISNNIKEEKKEDCFTRYVYDLLLFDSQYDHSSEKNIVLNVTNLNIIQSFCYCHCFDHDYYNYISSNLDRKKKIVDSSLLLNSFDYFNDFKLSQNSSFFKSVELLRNSNYFISHYFKCIFQLNKDCNYQNVELNKECISFLKNFSKFLFDKAEFLVNSNFNLFSLNTESRSNLVYFFRLIELYLHNIHSILIKIQKSKSKETNKTSRQDENQSDQALDENEKIVNEATNERVDFDFEDEIYNSIDRLVRSLVYFFHSMLDSDCLSYVIVHHEVGRILSLIILLSKLDLLQMNFDEKKPNRISIDEGQISDFINKITSKCGVFSYSCFFEPSSLLLLSTFSSSAQFTNILKNNDKSIIQICKYGNSSIFVKIPSDSLSVLRSLMILIHPSLTKVLISNFYYIFYPSVVDVFRLFSGMKIALIDIMIEKVVRRLLSNQEFNVIQNLVFPYLEKYAKEQIDQENKEEISFVFGVANRIIDILNSAKIK